MRASEGNGGVRQYDLRPLGIGEIFDRAVTLFVRHFAVLILILALVAVPVAIGQYIAAPQTTAMLEDVRRVLSLPPGHQREAGAVLAGLFAKNRVGQSGLALVVISTIFGALSGCACVIAIARSYAGQLPSVREVYREALRRWLSQLTALVVFGALAFTIVLGLTIVGFFVALAIGALAIASTPLATIVGIPAALIGVVLIFAVVALTYFAAEMSFISIALEDRNPLRGIAQGLRRTLSPPVFWRSMLVATIVFVVSTVGEVLLLAIAAGVSVLTHVAAAYPVIAVVGGIVLNALVTTFIVIYAFDVRVRREGYDLVLAVASARTD